MEANGVQKILSVIASGMALVAGAAAETARITFVGDVMCQGTALEPYKTAAGWDFTPIFRDVRPLLEKSDYVFGNLETPLAPDDRDLTNRRWEFCSPRAFAEAVKAAGIDFVFTANNHCLDRGTAGVPRTLATLDAVGLPHTGTFASAADAAKPAVVDVKGFRLGVLAYTYGSNAFSNHCYLDDANRWMVNLFQQQELADPRARAWFTDRGSAAGRAYAEWEKTNRPENLTLPVYERQEPHDAERAKLKADVARMKDARPDLTLISMHTGGQYNPAATKYTKELVDFLWKAGVDIIAGTHEHVVHGSDVARLAENRIAVYSLGNFNSLNGIWNEPFGRMADYSVAWHLYLCRDASGKAQVERTTFTILKCVKDGAPGRVRVVPAAELYIRLDAPAERAALRADMMTIAKRFCGTDFDRLGVALEYPLAAREVRRMVVDDKVPAGNLVVERIEGDQVSVHQELRDTKGDWFYWAGRVVGVQGRTLTFKFTKSDAVGLRGPCVSLDRGRTWSYAAEKRCTRRSFTYTVPADAEEVWLYETVPYLQKDWDAFIAGRAAWRGTALETGVLCTSRKGVPVEKARVGCLKENPKYRLFLSARRHCSETMASFVLEGVLDAALADDATGKWFRENAEIMVVPFMDKDGVEAGDQGKNRSPHDHNRDYTAFIYPETRGIRDWIREHAGNRIDIFFDFHCPWLHGGGNETTFQVHGPNAENNAKMVRFGKIMERVQSGGMAYREADDIRWNVGWNGPRNYLAGRAVKMWALQDLRCGFVSEFEIPFATSGGKTVTPRSCRQFGRDAARAFKEYLETDHGEASR